MNPSNGLATSSAANLRPRARRLISGLSGDEDEGGTALESTRADSTRRASPLPFSYDARPVSPIPAAHPQRATEWPAGHRDGFASERQPSRRQRKGNGESQTLSGLWGTSWTTLQGLASDLLGSDLNSQEGNGSSNKARVRRPLSTLDRQRSSSSMQWGPSSRQALPNGASTIGIGTKEEQTAAFRAQKRRDLLTRQESSYADTLGKYKRRLSDDRASASAPPGAADDDGDREALVYVHHVSKADTLAGITIRYNINANALRKANRMWPNDTIQIRQTLLLPVDACAVKGRPVPGPGEEIDLLGSESEALSSLQAEEVPAQPSLTVQRADILDSASARHRANSASTQHTATTASVIVVHPAGEISPAWTHDSWVMLPGHTRATEIVRLPRRAIAYFPPARRKSNSYSDFETPRSSVDLGRGGGGGADGTAHAAGANHPAASPFRQTPPRQNTRGQRRLSSATNGYFPSYLTGPGGVGTLDRGVNMPGPAQDGLNKMFAKHLPNVAPPKNQSELYQPGLPLFSDDPSAPSSGHGTASSSAYPGGAAGAGGSGMNLENMGGAFESWVRRLASKAATQFPTAERQHMARASVGTPSRGVGGVGDLIEMTDDLENFEIGGDDEDAGSSGPRGDFSRGRQGNVATGPTTSATSYFENAAKERGSGGGGRGSSRVAGKSGKAD